MVQTQYHMVSLDQLIISPVLVGREREVESRTA